MPLFRHRPRVFITWPGLKTFQGKYDRRRSGGLAGYGTAHLGNTSPPLLLFAHYAAMMMPDVAAKMTDGLPHH